MDIGTPSVGLIHNSRLARHYIVTHGQYGRYEWHGDLDRLQALNLGSAYRLLIVAGR